MKTQYAILALVFASLLTAAASFAAGEPEAHHHVKIKIDDGSELIDVDAENLEVGEARESYTDSGKKVLITRTEKGYELEVDGKKIDLGMSHGDGAESSVFVHGDHTSKVIVRAGGDKDVDYAFVHGDGEHTWVEHGDHGEHTWIAHGEGGDGVFVIKTRKASEHLLESGVLDDLDEDTRQRILDTLKEVEGPKIIKKQARVEIHEEHDDED